MSLLDVAVEYASHRALSWGRMFVCGRDDARYSYRILVGKSEAISVVTVPNLPVDEDALALVAWLFGRHTMYLDAGMPFPSTEAWREAESIYIDLCMMAEITPSADAFVRKRQSLTLAS